MSELSKQYNNFKHLLDEANHVWLRDELYQKLEKAAKEFQNRAKAALILAGHDPEQLWAYMDHWFDCEILVGFTDIVFIDNTEDRGVLNRITDMDIILSAARGDDYIHKLIERVNQQKIQYDHARHQEKQRKIERLQKDLDRLKAEQTA